MAIKPNKYYPKQMNGAVISAYGQARDDEYSDALVIENYLYNLSLDTAKETELENIGRIIGYPRPLVPVGFDAENKLLLGDLPLKTDVIVGLSNTDQILGGILTSIESSDVYYMSLATYVKFLKFIAYIKRYGITIDVIDKIASLITNNYEIKWQENGDVELHFLQAIGYRNLWILTQVFYKFCTSPQVIITAVS